MALAQGVLGHSALLFVITPSELSRKMAGGERSFSVALPGLSLEEMRLKIAAMPGTCVLGRVISQNMALDHT